MAIEALLIILVVLLILLIIGVPISYAIGISSLAAILRIVPLDVAVLTGAQRTFVGMSKFSTGDFGKASGSIIGDKRWCQCFVWCYFRFCLCGGSCGGQYGAGRRRRAGL